MLRERPNGSFELREPNGTISTFHAFDLSNVQGVLESVEDRNGNRITYQYDHQGLLASVTDTLGWIMYKKGIPSAAISLFREAIEGYPEAHPLRGTVRYHLARSYERNGETGRAITELKRALDEVTTFAEREGVPRGE